MQRRKPPAAQKRRLRLSEQRERIMLLCCRLCLQQREDSRPAEVVINARQADTVLAEVLGLKRDYVQNVRLGSRHFSQAAVQRLAEKLGTYAAHVRLELLTRTRVISGPAETRASLLNEGTADECSATEGTGQASHSVEPDDSPPLQSEGGPNPHRV